MITVFMYSKILDIAVRYAHQLLLMSKTCEGSQRDFAVQSIFDLERQTGISIEEFMSMVEALQADATSARVAHMENPTPNPPVITYTVSMV